MTTLTQDPDASIPIRLAAPSALMSMSAADKDVLVACYATLDRIRGANGLYLASPSADYSKAWVRDNVYEVMPYADKASHHYEETYRSLLDILRRHEFKIDSIVRAKPSDRDAYIHARFHPETYREFEEPWGNKQNDATGAFMWGIAQGIKNGKPLLRDERDRRLVQKLVKMHIALQYWDDQDNGMWEENEELHASSIGASLAGLRALKQVGFDVPQDAIARGEAALAALLPRESPGKETDLALLSLCWPYNVVTPEQRHLILQQVEERLLRERGVIRYEGDSYYSKLSMKHGRDRPRAFYHGDEAEWTFGLPWLSLIYRHMAAASHPNGDPTSKSAAASRLWSARADHFLERTAAVQNEDGSLPELYFAGSEEFNPNTPLGWSVAMYIMALEAKARSA